MGSSSNSASGCRKAPPPPPPPRQRRFKIWTTALLLLSLVGACLYAYLSSGLLLGLDDDSKSKAPTTITPRHFKRMRFAMDSFRFPDSWPRNLLMVDLPAKCQIPDTSPWSSNKEGLKKQVVMTGPSRKLLRCNNNSRRRISYVQQNKIFLDFNLLQNLTSSNNKSGQRVVVNCCYKSIVQRILQHSLEDKNNYTAKADTGFRYSKDCEPMSNVTIPNSMFVKVECKQDLQGSNSSSILLYEKFHAVALLPPPPPPPNDTTIQVGVDATRSKRVREITDFWHQCLFQGEGGEGGPGPEDQKLCAGFRATTTTPTQTPPPNVLLLGIDSTSRLNFRRWMTKTVAFLEGAGAVEMLGYSKVGMNTFPNLVSMFMSLSEAELAATCERNASVDPLDDCPHIWKDYSASKYLTAHLEDHPAAQIFHTARTGFVSPPSDIYLRPFMQALYKKGLSKPHCDVYESMEELILNFAVELMTTAASKSVPTLISTWMSGLSHGDPNGIQSLDDLFHSTLKILEEKGLLTNTILLLVSDHGYRHLPAIRNTLSGHFEVKLPALWIRLPPESASVRRRKSSNKNAEGWMLNLMLNRRILATPYDVHATLHHILTSANSEYKKDLSKEAAATEWGFTAKGSSLFHPLPHRNCQEAHIPREFCPCETPVQYEDAERILIAAAAAVEYINRQLPADVCQPLSVSSVFSSGLVRDPSEPEWTTSPSEEPKEGDGLVLGIDVMPGEMRFEALVEWDNKSAAFTTVRRNSYLMRTNEFNSSLIRCVRGKLRTAPSYWERCICK